MVRTVVVIVGLLSLLGAGCTPGEDEPLAQPETTVALALEASTTMSVSTTSISPEIDETLSTLARAQSFEELEQRWADQRQVILERAPRSVWR